MLKTKSWDENKYLFSLKLQILLKNVWKNSL